MCGKSLIFERRKNIKIRNPPQSFLVTGFPILPKMHRGLKHYDFRAIIALGNRKTWVDTTKVRRFKDIKNVQIENKESDNGGRRNLSGFSLIQFGQNCPFVLVCNFFQNQRMKLKRMSLSIRQSSKYFFAKMYS